MTPEAENAKIYLNQVFEINDKIKKKKLRIKGLEAKIEYKSPAASDMPKSEHSGNSTEKKLHQYIEKKIILERQIAKLTAKKLKLIPILETQINLIEKEKYRNVLKFRFLDCLTWDEISGKMGNSDVRGIRRLCERAIENFYKKVLK